MSADELIVAVDGGNSKTDVLLLRTDGTVLASVRGAGSSPHQLGLEPAVQVVGDLVDRAWLAAGLGVAQRQQGRRRGGVHGRRRPALGGGCARRRRGAQGWAKQNHVANDVFAVLWAATGSGHGVAVTVGAGVNCVGACAVGAPRLVPGARRDHR